MATLADFVGTWYFRGYPTKPCSIRLLNATRVEVRDEWGKVFSARLEGGSTLIAEPPGGINGVISSDLKTIQWTNGEPWTRDHS